MAWHMVVIIFRYQKTPSIESAFLKQKKCGDEGQKAEKS